MLMSDSQWKPEGDCKGNQVQKSDYEKNLQANIVQQDSKEMVWHRRYGHLGMQNLQRLVRDNLVKGLDYKDLDFREACIEDKHKKTPFKLSGCKRATEPLDLVHSDVCGKLNAQSLGGAEYFLTFIDKDGAE